jgi:hypothetical protein
MAKNYRAFGDLLKLVIRRIATERNQKTSFVQETIGEKLGVSKHGIRYWEAGHIPADIDTVNNLILVLSSHHGFRDSAESQRLLSFSGVSALSEKNAMDFSNSHNRKPVTHPQNFYGRNLQLNYLFDGLRKMTCMAIYGPRKSGKTSLLKIVQEIAKSPISSLRLDQRKKWLPSASEYCWIYLDLEDERYQTKQGFLSEILKCLKISTPEPCNISTFLDLVANQVFSPTVILLDELEAGLMSPELDVSFWQSLRSWTTVQSNGNVVFITASILPPVKIAKEYLKPSPFFNIFRLIQELGPNTNQESMDQILSYNIPSIDVEWIYLTSRGWPALVEIICDVRIYTLDHDYGGDWKEEAYRQIQPFQNLLEL